MKTQICLSLLFLLLFSSCATIMNKSFYQIEVKSVPAKIKLQVGDSTYTTPTKITVERSKKDLQITASNDSITRKYEIESYLSSNFYYGNCGFFHFFPLGYLIDLTNSRRYTYGTKLYFNLYDTINDYNRVSPDLLWHKFTEKGNGFLKLSLPVGINLYIRNKTGYYKSHNPIGLSTELGYFYQKNRYLSIGAGIIPAFMDDGGREIIGCTGIYIDVNQGFQIRSFLLSYGLNWSKNEYYHNYLDAGLPWLISKDTLEYSIVERKIGLSFTTKYKINDYIQIGAKYLPSFYNIGGSTKFQYTHFYFFDLILNFNIRAKSWKDLM